MRRLHPIGRHEVPADHGTIRQPDGRLDVWTVHALPEQRHVVRVAEGDGTLWHLTLDHAARPERLQARWQDGGRSVEATLTFFDDEVLIWRRGAEPGSQAMAIPTGARLLWPPIAGRDWCLAGIAVDNPEEMAAVIVQRRPLADGALDVCPVTVSARREGDVLTLAMAGRPEARMTLDPAGRLRAWQEGDILFERVAGAGP